MFKPTTKRKTAKSFPSTAPHSSHLTKKRNKRSLHTSASGVNHNQHNHRLANHLKHKAFISSSSPTSPHLSTSTINNTQNAPTTINKRHYDIPRYTGFRNAFSDQLKLYSKQKITPVSLHHFLDCPVNHLSYGSNPNKPAVHYGSQQPSLDVHHLSDQKYTPEYTEFLLRNSQFLWQELPVRLAQRVVELENLPYNLSSTPQFELVRHWYETSFRDIITSLPPIDLLQERNFTRVLNSVLNRHRSVIPTLAQGILFQKSVIEGQNNGQPCPYIKSFLDNFYSSRIAIRMLIAQHIALHKPIPGFCGTIHLELDPVAVIRGAASEVTDLCDRTYGKSPDINIFTSYHNSHKLEDHTFPHMDSYNPQSRLNNEKLENELIMEKMKNLNNFLDYKSERGRVSYISSHLHHMVFEVLKNSARAHAEHYANHRSVPDINVFVSFGENNDDIAIKISDVGGGIPAANQAKLFSYLFTTANPQVQQMLLRFDISNAVKNAPGLDHGATDDIRHDDNITMLAPTPQALSRPLSIRSKTGLTSISQSSILGRTEPSPMSSAGGNAGGSLAASGDESISLTSSSTPQHQSANDSQPNSNEENGVFLIANEQQGFGSGMQKLTPIAGFGYGLGLSKLMAEFGNGDLRLLSTEGHGTDAMLTVHKALSQEHQAHAF